MSKAPMPVQRPDRGAACRRACCAGLAVVTVVAALMSVSSTRAASDREKITVTPAGAATLKAAVAAHRGHVVVVNFWATWCAPCCAEFPDLVTLQNTYRKQGLVVIGVSADEKADIKGKVIPFLVSHRAYFPQYLEQARDPETIIDAFNANWQGDLPQTFVYDKRGKLVKELDGEQTLAQFDAAVKPYLGK